VFAGAVAGASLEDGVVAAPDEDGASLFGDAGVVVDAGVELDVAAFGALAGAGVAAG
jgi:hypothetical protein